MSRRGQRLAVVVACLALALPAAAPAEGGATATNGRIAFTRYNDGLYTIRPDGTGLRQVTTSDQDLAVWSPDGTRLAVARCDCMQPEATSRLLVMRADGSRAVRVSRRAVSIQDPVWSPDGRFIAYVDHDIMNPDLPGPYVSAIRVVRSDGTGQVKLTGYGSWNFSPAWSPDGRWIAFSSYRDGDSEIYLVRRDGTGLRQLTHNLLIDDGGPQWSPDGKAIAFTSFERSRESYVQWVSVVRPDGSAVRELTSRDAMHDSMGWSPDGRRLLVRRSAPAVDGPTHTTLVVMAADGTQSRDIVAGRNLGGGAWSPDGRKLLYSRGEYVFIIDAGGGVPFRLTKGMAESWQPRPAR